MSIPAPAPPPVPDPKLDPTTLSSQLPHAQIENLRYKVMQIMESINGLLVTLNTPGMQLAAWPDLMTKYNVLLSKTHTLAASLSTPPTRKGTIGFRQIVPTPFAVNPDATPEPTGLDPQLDAMLEALLDGRRSISVTKTDVSNVARLHLPGTGESALDVTLSRLEQVQKAHDARCARGVEAVRQLKDKYDWKSRLLFDDSESESSVAVASHHSSEEMGSVVGDEEMVEVAPPPDEEIVQLEEGDTPQTRVFLPVAEDSDSDSEEEVQVAINVGENLAPGGDEGSESDGMEDVSVYQNGPPQPAQPQQVHTPVSLLDNLFVIDQ
ncbi:unnamed protein product [Rhizoctonia solani]|uniref:Mediator of RNA polymerase II transcription subunit 8 n=1 Tax=Rhizoctonia solani TaxID=456999 RepID=A0A8H3E339_9AGAM|nr:unnamed protein product [Rhizoctonia solani]